MLGEFIEDSIKDLKGCLPEAGCLSLVFVLLFAGLIIAEHKKKNPALRDHFAVMSSPEHSRALHEICDGVLAKNPDNVSSAERQKAIEACEKRVQTALLDAGPAPVSDL
jgi:hypothetical protein